jgi:hypothetical protein
MNRVGSVIQGGELGALVGAVTALAACHATPAAPAEDLAVSVDAGSGMVAVASVDVEIPPPVVSEDPEVPLHEALIGSAPTGADRYGVGVPPKPVLEDVPDRPSPDETWIAGYWWYSRKLARYVWVAGTWRKAPPERSWSAGAWVPADGGRFVWAPGCWGPQGFRRDEGVSDTAPPVVRPEAFGRRPEPSFAWTPGFYAHRDTGYEWVGGSWARPPASGLGWVDARYVGAGGRYLFQPGHWDYPASQRGVAYAPDIHAQAGGHIKPVPVEAAVVGAYVRFVAASARAISQGIVPKIAPGGDLGAKRP